MFAIETSAHDELARLAVVGQRDDRPAAGRGVGRDESDAARRDLVAAVSHDLRTPITSLRLLTEAIADDVVDERDPRALPARMRTHIDALTALIDDLFELSRLEARRASRWSLARWASAS